jgi:predicted DNA repair protein MutK
MPAGSLLTLLDDIASILDDVSILTKKAAAKTAGVLGDDLALNAQQVSGVVSKRELPVVWAVAKGSFVNKLILVPLALLIGTFAPWGIVPLLMIGGLYLCFEGCEKLAHHFLHRRDKSAEDAGRKIAELAATAPEVKVESEADKIKGAVRTDFVLSAEIIAITLGTVAGQDFTRQVLVLSSIAIVMTVGVYGLVAGIVKLDDAGLYLTQCRGGFQQRLGRAILWAAPFLMKTLSVLGTAAMFLVGGGIVTHGIPWLHHGIAHAAESLRHTGGIGAMLAPVVPTLLNGLCGLVAGTLVLLIVSGIRKLRGKSTAAASIDGQHP